MIILYILLPIFVLFILYLLSLSTSKRKNIAFEPFEEHLIAHRGFFDNDGCCPENSLAAFRRAVENGYGIELDVQMTLDKKLVVFHDDSLLRMCGDSRLLEECTYAELEQLSLAKSTEKIPLFKDVLSLIDGKVPLIVEIKTTDKYKEVCDSTAKMLDQYKGVFCMESFNPFIVAWFKKNRPEVIRGQLSTNFFKDEPKMGFFKKLVLSNLMLNFKAKPDFIAYHHFHKNQFSYKLLRKLYKVKNVAWTIKSQQQLEDAKDLFTCIIFDSFTPKDIKKTH